MWRRQQPSASHLFNSPLWGYIKMWNPFKKSSLYEFQGWKELPTETVLEAEAVTEMMTGSSKYQERQFSENDLFSVKLRRVVRGILLALVLLVPVFFVPFTLSDVLGLNKQVLIYGLVFLSAICGWS